jgi:hypothetical protein
MNARLVRLGLAAAVAALFTSPVLAQTAVRTQVDTQRDLTQQQRIESGVQSGQLTTSEAGKLERGQAHVDKMEANADRNGSVSAREQARITRAQNRQSARIYNKKHNGTVS